MKTIYVCFMLLMLFKGSSCQDFRKVNMGMSSRIVREIEDFEFDKEVCHSKNNCILVYKGYISGDSVWLWYQFLYDTLVSSSYQFYPSSTALSGYTSLLKYVDILKIKYSDPDQILWEWQDQDMKSILEANLPKADDNFFILFAQGDLRRVVYQWEFTNLIIALSVTPSLSRVNESAYPFMMIRYDSYPTYQRLLNKYQMEFAKDNF